MTKPFERLYTPEFGLLYTLILKGFSLFPVTSTNVGRHLHETSNAGV